MTGLPPIQSLAQLLTCFEPEAPSLPVEEAQLYELNLAFAAYNEPVEQIAPGSRVYEKHGLSQIKEQFSRDRAFILWRLLDPNDKGDRSLMKRVRCEFGQRANCLIATRDDTGGVKLFTHELRCLTMIRPIQATSESADEATTAKPEGPG